MRQTTVLASLILFASLCIGIDTADAQCVLPYTLTNGAVADATQVMANFDAVIGCFPAEPFAITIGGTGAGTAQAAFDNLSPLTAQGDVPYFNGSHNTRLAAGTVGYFLQTAGAGANPSWAAALIPGNNLSDVLNTSTARSNLGLGSIATHPATDYAATANNLSDLGSASTARTNLGLGTAATQNTGTSGATISLNNGSNNLSGTNVHSGSDNFTGTLQVGGFTMTFPGFAASLATLNGNQTYTGQPTFADSMYVGGFIQSQGANNSYFRTYNTSSGTDQKYTEWADFGSGFIGRFVNDAYTSAQNFMNVTRNTGTYSVKYVLFPNGNIGIDTLTPAYPLDVSGDIQGSNEIISSSAGSLSNFRMIGGNYGAFFRNDGTQTFFLLTASGSQYGTWNSLRPLTIVDATGAVSIDGTGAGTTFGGGVTATSYTGSGSGLTGVPASGITGLGTAATQNTGTSGGTLCLLSASLCNFSAALQAETVALEGSYSGANPTTGGWRLTTNFVSSTYTDTTGINQAEVTVDSLKSPILAASAPVTYAQVETLRVGSAPTAGTNVTITNGYSAYFVGGVLVGGALTSDTLKPTNALGVAYGGTGAGTAQAAFDALSPLTAQGDLPYYNGTHNTRLAAGTAGYFLKTGGAGANPAWAQALIPGNNLSDVGNANTSRTNLGLGTTSQPSFETLMLSGSYSAPFVGTNGYRYQSGGLATYTDTTGGSEGDIAVDTFFPPTLAATVATTYSQAETLRVGTCPSAGTNVTITSGKCYSAFFNGAIDINGQATASILNATTEIEAPDGTNWTSSGLSAIPALPNQLSGTFWGGPCGGSSGAPGFRALCGADLPFPTGSSIGGIESITAASHKWINAISTAGVPNQTQPACGDLSNSGTGCQAGVVTTQSWTPTILGSTTAGTWTYSTQAGYYTKISDSNGCTVIAHGRITTSADSGAPVGNAEIGGLPLTSAAQSSIFPGTVEFGLISGVNLDTGYTMLTGTVTASGTVAAIREAGSGKTQANVAIGNITANVASFDIVFTITYNATGC